MIKTKSVKIIQDHDWDQLVKDTYKRPYCFQQQDGCKNRGIEYIQVPDDHPYDYPSDTIPTIINHPDMGVSFKAWLKRDPNQSFPDKYNPSKLERQWGVDLWWNRNFYPHVSMVINDLYKRGLIEAGEYGINIDW